MNFGLLKQERGCTVFAKQLDEDGKDLAYAVPDVDHVPHRPFGRSAELPDLQLKGVAAPCAEPSDFDFVKKAGVLPESLQLLSCLLPLSTVRLQRNVGQQVGHVITFRIPSEVGGVVGAVWSRTHWRTGIKRPRPVVVKTVGVGQFLEGTPVVVAHFRNARFQLVVAVAGKGAVCQKRRQGNQRHRGLAGVHWTNVKGLFTLFCSNRELPRSTRELPGNFYPDATFITGQSCLDGKGHSAHISKNHRNTTLLGRLRSRFEFEARPKAISPTAVSPAVMGNVVEAAKIVDGTLERRIADDDRVIPKRADHGQERCLACAVVADEKRQGSQHDILLLAEAAVVLQRDPVHVRLGAEPGRPIAAPRSVATDSSDGMCSSTGRRDPTPEGSAGLTRDPGNRR